MNFNADYKYLRRGREKKHASSLGEWALTPALVKSANFDVELRRKEAMLWYTCRTAPVFVVMLHYKEFLKPVSSDLPQYVFKALLTPEEGCHITVNLFLSMSFSFTAKVCL